MWSEWPFANKAARCKSFQPLWRLACLLACFHVSCASFSVVWEPSNIFFAQKVGREGGVAACLVDQDGKCTHPIHRRRSCLWQSFLSLLPLLLLLLLLLLPQKWNKRKIWLKNFLMHIFFKVSFPRVLKNPFDSSPSLLLLLFKQESLSRTLNWG